MPPPVPQMWSIFVGDVGNGDKSGCRQGGRQAGRQGGGRGDRRMPIKSCQGDRYWCRVPQGYFEQVNRINSVLYCLDITKISASKMHRHQMKIKTNTYVHMYNMRQNVE